MKRVKRRKDKSTSKQRPDPISKWLGKTYKKAFTKFSSPRVRENPDIQKFAKTGNPKFLEKAIREREEIALDSGIYQIKMYCGLLIGGLQNDGGTISPTLSKKIIQLCKQTLYATVKAHIPQKKSKGKQPYLNYDIDVLHTYRSFHEDIKKLFRTITRKQQGERYRVLLRYVEEKKLVNKLKPGFKYKTDSDETAKSQIAEKLSKLPPPRPSNIAWKMTSAIFNKSERTLKGITANLRELLGTLE